MKKLLTILTILLLSFTLVSSKRMLEQGEPRIKEIDGQTCLWNIYEQDYTTCKDKNAERVEYDMNPAVIILSIWGGLILIILSGLWIKKKIQKKLYNIDKHSFGHG